MIIDENYPGVIYNDGIYEYHGDITVNESLTINIPLTIYG